MNVFKPILRELIGLVVDDVGFAASVVGWIILAWSLSAFVLPPSPSISILLFAGLSAILMESVLRRAGRTR